MLATTRICRYLRPSLSRQKALRFYSSTDTVSSSEGNASDTTASKVGGFAKAFEKQSSILSSEETEQNHTFASLLRNSKLMDVSVQPVDLVNSIQPLQEKMQ